MSGFEKLSDDPRDWPMPHVLAHTLYGECRGEPAEGVVAVAWVIWNRALNPRWWGKDVKEVCLKPWQFSCWNKNDHVRQKLIDLDIHQPIYHRLFDIGVGVVSGKFPDPTIRADHYLRTDWIERTHWAQTNPLKATRKIGAHTFFRLELTEPRTTTVKAPSHKCNQT